MVERLGLVIGSQCERRNLLSHLPQAASDLAAVLTHPDLGRCLPALEDGRAVVIDPGAAELDLVMTEAFARASAAEGTLFLALAGHSHQVGDQSYLLARDSPDPPSSRTAFPLAYRVSELLATYPMINGLVLLLDTCHAGTEGEQAAQQWSAVLGRPGHRYEIVAAANGPGTADGCFFRTLLQLMRHGSATGSEWLHCTDIRSVVAATCARPEPLHIAFNGRSVTAYGDQGMWLAWNPGSVWHGTPLAGRAATGTIDWLVRGYQVTAALEHTVRAAGPGGGLVLLDGPAGSGRSTTIAALAHPEVTAELRPARFLHAVLMHSAGRTDDELAGELAAQLRISVSGFGGSPAHKASSEAEWNAADPYDRAVLIPLRIVAAHRRTPIRIAVDPDPDASP